MKVSKDALRSARQLLGATLVDGRIDGERARKIVTAIKEKKPRNYLGILTAYINLLRLEFEKRRALVESAQALSPEVTDQVTKGLQQKYGQDLSTEFKTTPALLGGMRVKVGSDVWDGSVKARIERLADSF
ncbi:hypothetical protein BH23VER1_BH23VER1_02690 [soil metagenome]